MVEEALGCMKTGKAAGLTAVTADWLKVVGEDCIKRLMDEINGLLGGARMPESWRRRDLPPLCKKKPTRSCGSYRSVKLLEHGMEVIERIFEGRLKKSVKLDEMQMGIAPGKGTTDAVFSVRQMIEKYEATGKKLYWMFVDLEKVFDQVPRKVIWWALSRKGVVEKEIRAITEIYNCVETAVRMEDRRSEWFKVKVGVHQGSVLSPLLFAVAWDEITKDIRDGIPKEYLYADDLVLFGDCWSEVERRYSKWKRALQQKRLKVNVNKTKTFYTSNIMVTQSKVDPCAVREKRVGNNSIKCEKCNKWVHKRGTGIKGVWHVWIILNANVVEEM